MYPSLTLPAHLLAPFLPPSLPPSLPPPSHPPCRLPFTLLLPLLLQIPAGRRSVLDSYGEVILRGWREAVGACLPEIETSLIQVSHHLKPVWSRVGCPACLLFSVHS